MRKFLELIRVLSFLIFLLSSSLYASDKINVLWVRHGFTCANVVIANIGTLLRKTNNRTDLVWNRLLVRDSQLTDIGFSDAHKKGIPLILEGLTNNFVPWSQRINQNRIYTSNLLRTIETAHALRAGTLFEDETRIRPIPSISELRIPLLPDPENNPQNLDVWMKFFFENSIPHVEIFQVDPDKTEYRAVVFDLKRDPVTRAPNFEDFKRKVLPYIVENDTSLADGDITFFVTHSRFLNKITGGKLFKDLPRKRIGSVGAVLQTFQKNAEGAYEEVSAELISPGISEYDLKDLYPRNVEKCKFDTEAWQYLFKS